MQSQLIFLISPPRAGSTLLQRMLGAHGEISTHPEPHLISPLAYLGFHDRVDAAPFDHINASEAIRSFVSELPNGEDDYLDALRAYTDTLYGRALKPTGKKYFLDKTPANALVLPFLQKLYPNAKYIVLTRHPVAVFSSYANSFFNGSWTDAHRFNPVLEKYVPAMAKFIRDDSVDKHAVHYETLVADPEKALAGIFEYLDLENQSDAVNYGAHEQKKGMGDPITVASRSRPTTESLAKWAAELNDDAEKRKLAESMVARLDDADLAAWQTPRDTFWAPLNQVGGALPKTPVLNKYTFQRRVLLALRRDVHQRPHGKIIRKIRYFCDSILRDAM